MNLSDLIAARSRDSVDKTGLYFFERRADPERGLPEFRCDLGYAEFDRRVNRARHLLAGRGVARGDVANLHLPNCPAFLLLWFARAPPPRVNLGQSKIYFRSSTSS